MEPLVGPESDSAWAASSSGLPRPASVSDAPESSAYEPPEGSSSEAPEASGDIPAPASEAESDPGSDPGREGLDDLDRPESPSERRRAAVAEERLPFGELAVLEEMVTREQLNLLLFQQADRRETEHKNVRIGTLLVREGLLTKKQAKRLLRIQRSDGPIAGFQLLQHLGSGGMGSVFRAIEGETGRELALKILPPRASRDSRYRTRFLREATLLSRLDHPHLVRCYSHGESDGHLYFAMEYVQGLTGRALIKRDGAFSEKQLRRTFRQVLEAMVCYWKELIVHRDLKPENILFDDALEAKLADLGLSRQLDDDVHITRVGKTLGTPLYISPEMARGQQDIDIRADLYSLGATFYHLGTGVPPFVGASQAELLKAHVEDEPVRPRLKNPRLSEGMEAILLRLLEKRPSDRFAGPSDVLAALDRLERGEDPMPGWRRRARASDRPQATAERPTERAERAHERASGERRLRSNGAPRLGSSATRTGYSGGPSRERDLGRPALVVAALAFLLLFAMGVLLGSRGRGPELAREGGVEASPSEAVDLLELVSRDPEAAASAALAWCDQNPDQLGEQVVRLELVDKVLAESSPQRHALRLRLLQARELLADEGERALDALRTKLISLVEARRFSEARAALDAFPTSYRRHGPLKDAWEELRRELGSADR
ncbi:MAG: protein kinase [Planctomycetota bacterium]